MMTIQEKIRSLREKNDLTQADMAERMNLSQNGYAKIERGDTQLKLEKLEQIANLFEMDLIELLSINDKGNVFLASDSFHSQNQENFHNIHNYYGENEKELLAKIEKLELSVSYKDELLKQQEKMLADKEREINMLNEFIQALKNK